MTTQSASALPVARAHALLKLRGWRAQAVAGLVIVLVVVGVIANQQLSQRFSAAGYAADFVARLNSGDAGGAWSTVTVGTTVTRSFDLDLAVGQGFTAEIATARSRHGVFSIGPLTTVNGAYEGQLATVTYREQAGTNSFPVLIQRDASQHRYLVYPSWRVMFQPVVLTLARSTSAGAAAFDGIPVPDSAKAIRVLPGPHLLTQAGSALFAPTTQADFINLSTHDPAVTLPATASGDGLAKVTQAVASAIQACAVQNFPIKADCPYPGGGASSWAPYVGPATLRVSPEGELLAQGHWQVIGQDPMQHVVTGMAYSVGIALSNGQIRVGPFHYDRTSGVPGGVPAAVRPSEPGDAAVLSAAKQALQNCLGGPGSYDCPNKPGFGKLVPLDDPYAAASVRWKGDTGFYEVVGPLHVAGPFSDRGYWIATVIDGPSGLIVPTIYYALTS